MTHASQTHMSSKFLLMDSGIFGLVTRTAFIGMVETAPRNKERGGKNKKINHPLLTTTKLNRENEGSFFGHLVFISLTTEEELFSDQINF